MTLVSLLLVSVAVGVRVELVIASVVAVLGAVVAAARRAGPPFDPSTFLERFDEMHGTLEAAGFAPFSDWWWDEFARWVHALADGRRQWLIRAGRRAGKSGGLCKLGVAWALFGPWRVPRGEVGVVAIVSVSKDEAAQRLRTIAAMLDALKVRYERRGEEIALSDRPVVFKVFPCTTTGVVGFTAILVIGDEAARWESRDGMANPARDVIGSLRPTLATQPWGFIVLSSSPWGDDDYHAEQFDLGDSDFQIASYAPTWIANPSITEADTRRLEPHEPTWRREYLAVPSAGAESFFDAAAIDAAIDDALIVPAAPRPELRAFAGKDIGLRSDGSALAVVRVEHELIVVVDLIELTPTKREPLKPSAVVGTFARAAKLHRCRSVVSDHFYIESVREHLAAAGLGLVAAPAGLTGKVETYTRVRALLHEGRIRIPKHDRLIRQLREVQSRPTPGGALTITSPRRAGSHGDVASAFVLAVWAAAAALPNIPGATAGGSAFSRNAGPMGRPDNDPPGLFELDFQMGSDGRCYVGRAPHQRGGRGGF